MQIDGKKKAGLGVYMITENGLVFATVCKTSSNTYRVPAPFLYWRQFYITLKLFLFAIAVVSTDQWLLIVSMIRRAEGSRE